mmetsp:Transcript_18901/g.42663  ORF Transcript_18901/g.42663 Transcript_18901/m.42663 type:complete len:86 (+) Transcript_18901:1179-1436(+)
MTLLAWLLELGKPWPSPEQYSQTLDAVQSAREQHSAGRIVSISKVSALYQATRPALGRPALYQLCARNDNTAAAHSSLPLQLGPS